MSDTAIATVESHAVTVADNDNALNIPNGYICTVDRDSREGTIKIANALSDASSLAAHGDEHFHLVDVITTPGVRTRTGEECINTYLITAEGEILMSQSNGIARSAQQIVGLFNGDFGEEGIEVAVVTKELRNGNSLKTLHFFA